MRKEANNSNNKSRLTSLGLPESFFLKVNWDRQRIIRSQVVAYVLYSFFFVAVTNYHKLSSLNTTDALSYGSLEVLHVLMGLKSWCPQAAFLSRGTKGGTCFLPHLDC